MYGGQSGSQGFLIYKKKKTYEKAVYGYYEEDEMILLEGTLDEMTAIKAEKDAQYRNQNDKLKHVMVITFFVMLIMVITAFVAGTFLQGFAGLIFAVGGYMPLMIIYQSRQNEYASEELFQQFRRYHGCEHAAISWLTKYAGKEEVTIEKLKKTSIYDPECGTAYSGYGLTLSFVIAVLTANLMTIGLLKALGIAVLTFVLLILNIFNPYNPYKLLQRPVVVIPTDREYVLGVEMMKKLCA